MKALVTGATGFVGSHLVEALIREGHEVRCVTRSTSRLDWLKNLPVEIVRADMNDHASMIPVVRHMDWIFHVSGLTKAKKESEYYKANADTSRVLYEVCREVNPGVKKIVHISSLAAAGPSRPDKPRKEEDPLAPLTFYGKSKLEGEQYARAYMQHLPITIIRPPAVYGPREKDIFFYFRLIQNHIRPIIGTGKKQLSIVYVADLVEAILLAAKKEESTGQTYFVDDGAIYTWNDISRTIQQVMNRKAIPIRVPEFFVSVVAWIAEFFALFSSSPALLNRQKIIELKQAAWTCSSDKIRKELGFTSRYNFTEGCRLTYAWYRQNGWLK